MLRWDSNPGLTSPRLKCFSGQCKVVGSWQGRQARRLTSLCPALTWALHPPLATRLLTLTASGSQFLASMVFPVTLEAPPHTHTLILFHSLLFFSTSMTPHCNHSKEMWPFLVFSPNVFFFFFLLFIWLHWVLVATHGIFNLYFGMWDL